MDWGRKVSKAAEAYRMGGLTGLAAAMRDRLDAMRAERMRTVRRAWRRAIEFGIRPHLLAGRVTHVHGPAEIAYGPEDLLVVCVVRNGALYVPSFMEHYGDLGVAHCVFLDNGSTDATVEMLCEHPGVTVLRTDAPYERYENTMKRYLAQRFSRGRWHVCADIDELFDYPYAATLPLSGFLGYLNARGFTAVVTQMLDMFSDLPLRALHSEPGDRLKEKYAFYDITAIERGRYEWSEPCRPEIKMHWGGIRRAVFGTNNGLTKAALVRMDGKAKPFVEWHQVTGAVFADITCVLRHYPFVSTFPDKVLDAVRTGRYGTTTTDEYVAYAKGLAANPDVTLMRPSARRFSGLEDLIADEFLVVSDDYRRWVRRYTAQPVAVE